MCCAQVRAKGHTPLAIAQVIPTIISDLNNDGKLLIESRINSRTVIFNSIGYC
ncbi:MAG: hypothetical protein KME05_03345 [Gloeocapsa sp. UFS-A4-WI-NPMV-4B04]|nr:hypothetical protein [Gloeocapsa sp. UFS-A4-WI-NPMV-4B04]